MKKTKLEIGAPVAMPMKAQKAPEVGGVKPHRKPNMPNMIGNLGNFAHPPKKKGKSK